MAHFSGYLTELYEKFVGYLTRGLGIQGEKRPRGERGVRQPQRTTKVSK